MTTSLIAADVYGMTAGRAWSLVGSAIGLTGVVFGLLALARRRGGAVVAAVCGVAGAVIGALVVGFAEGGPGTGYGIVGGYISLVLGVVAAGLGGLALVRRAGVRAGARSGG